VLASVRVFWFVPAVVGVALVALLLGSVADVPPLPTPAVHAADELPEGAALARARYNEGDFAGALAAADAVDAAFRLGPAFATDENAWLVWADAQMTRALALRRLGRDADADEGLATVAALRPSYAPDKGFVPPKAVSRFEELRDALIAGPTCALTIVVDGAGSVVLDGRAREPGTIDVLPGIHFVGASGGPAPRGEVVGGAAGAPQSTAGIGPPGTSTPPSDDEAGRAWLWVGIGTGAVAVVAAVVAAVVVVNRGKAPANPGGVTVAIDTSKLDRP
jgi:hypothetical protein